MEHTPYPVHDPVHAKGCPDAASLVYIVRIGRHAKVGFTTNLPQRLKSFRTATAEAITVLATFPGGRAEEARLHRSLAETRLPHGEFFHFDWRLERFVDNVRLGDLETAWRWLDETHWRERERKKEAERQRRIVARRVTKAEKDAHYARLVADRRARLGW